MTRVLGLWLLMLGSCGAATNETAWQHFKSRFIAADGRLLDVNQHNISHSEGQGYAMLLAEHFQERPLFDTVWTWTRNNLQIRRDSLLAWSWGQRVNGEWLAVDYNNATDGDVLVAYALLRAARRWGGSVYAAEAARIVQSIRTHLAVPFGPHTLLLPGYTGFSAADGFRFNPSYQIPAAFRAFHAGDDPAFWTKVEEGARFMLDQSCANPQGLPADWLSGKDGRLANDTRKGGRFGYEAIRVFLYAAWENETRIPCGAAKLIETYTRLGRVPAWIDLRSGESAPYEASAGFYAVLAATAAGMGLKNEAAQLRRRAADKLPAEPDDYYSQALLLLSERELWQLRP